MRLEQLNYLIAIAQYHSMNKAADNIFVSQQTISNAIMQLEEEFQTKLVLRTNKGSYLTEAGQELSQAAQDFYTRCQVVKERAGQKKSPQKIHLLIEHSQLSTWNELFMFYADNYPEVELERTTIDYVDLEKVLDMYPDSMAVCYLHDEYVQKFSQDHICEVINSYVLSIFVSPNSPLANSKCVSLKNIHNMRFLFYTLRDKPSALTMLLEKYHLEDKGNKYIYQVTTELQKTLGQQSDVVCFAPMRDSLSKLNAMVPVKLKERLSLHFCCITKSNEIPSELIHALKSLN